MAKAPKKKKKNIAPKVDDTKAAKVTENKENTPAENEAEKDAALESFMNRSQEVKEDEKAPEKKGKLSRGAIGLIIR